MALWGGRFQGRSDPRFKRFNDSLRFDARLVHDDITGSIGWARAIERAGIITTAERERLIAALGEIDAGPARDLAAVIASGAEDVHAWVEGELIARVGDLGKKLHTGRSRNDQVATDLRLYLRREGAALEARVRDAQRSLIGLAERERGVIMPGYTHLQRAQPILFAHWCLAYVEMLERDRGRIADALARANECPLGSGALSGPAYPIDREALARDLGFATPTRNSLDAVSDRDPAAELLGAMALLAVHLSRLAEDAILYCSGEFAFLILDDAVSSGSSLMPQKKNPDAFELIRGKAGRIIGAHVALLTALKGLPLAYNKDMQEDKELLFDALDNLGMCLDVLPPMLDTLRVDRDAMASSAGKSGTTATELADHLTKRGVAFRDAHEIVGKIVRAAIESGRELTALTLADLRAHDPRFGDDAASWLDPAAAVERRDVIGGTAPRRVDAALGEARRRLESSR